MSSAAGEKRYICSSIDYFSKEEYSPDPNDSTMAIPYAVTRSTIFFLVATFLLCSGYCSCLVGHFARHRRLCTFVAGVIFIVSGLVMLFGLIMYISVFKAEVGFKLRPRSQLAPPTFTYQYGYSFLLYVSGFVTTELAGTSAIFLFIYSHQSEWRRKRLKEVRKYPTRAPPPPASYLHLDHVMYPCRRHPQAYVNSNSAIHFPVQYASPIPQRRYFFNKEPISESPCSIHRSASLSLKDVSAGAGGGTFYDFPPPPPTISYQFDDLHQHRSLSHFPRDLTMSTTMSTTVDVNLCDATSVATAVASDDYSPSIQHEFVTFDLDEPIPLAAQVRGAVAAAAAAGCLPPPTLSSATCTTGQQTDRPQTVRTEFSVDTLRRTTPV